MRCSSDKFNLQGSEGRPRACAQAYLQPCEKSPEEDEYLCAMLRDHTLFHLPPSRLSDVLSYFRSRQVTEGEVLIQKARAAAPYHLCIVDTGAFTCECWNGSDGCQS